MAHPSEVSWIQLLFHLNMDENDKRTLKRGFGITDLASLNLHFDRISAANFGAMKKNQLEVVTIYSRFTQRGSENNWPWGPTTFNDFILFYYRVRHLQEGLIGLTALPRLQNNRDSTDYDTNQSSSSDSSDSDEDAAVI